MKRIFTTMLVLGVIKVGAYACRAGTFEGVDWAAWSVGLLIVALMVTALLIQSQSSRR